MAKGMVWKVANLADLKVYYGFPLGGIPFLLRSKKLIYRGQQTCYAAFPQSPSPPLPARGRRQMGQGTVLCPTKETANESHSHGARSQSLPAPFLLLFPLFLLFFAPALSTFPVEKRYVYRPFPHKEEKS